jgi:glyoxylase-like metal-dependent hydrolase (beta-lactamase superfamily II)
VRQKNIHRLWGRLQGVRVRLDDIGNEVTRIRMKSLGASLLGFKVDSYLVGNILIDTGFPYVQSPLLAVLEDRDIRAVCCTHNHEDHTGNCAAIAAAHDCPVYLRHAEALWEEGVGVLAPYRRMWWGTVEPFEPQEMPEVVEVAGRRLRAVPAPGHSATQVALYEEATGDVFTGDLFVSPGASAVLVTENPWAAVASLRRVAALKPRRMLTGHGRSTDDPAPLLELKADRIEEAAMRAVELVAAGVPPRQVVRRVFVNGVGKDRFFEWMTSREFSRLNFVLAAVRHAPGALER